jgi:hypothetical protein
MTGSSYRPDTQRRQASDRPADGGPIDISVVILTQRRPEGLELAVRSVLRQTAAGQVAVELVIVDNDQLPSARSLVARLAAEAPFPVIFVHEPRAGVAHARNTALMRARARFVAFLDDDEEAPDDWLAELLAAQARFDADVVFGRVRGIIPDQVTRHRAYLTAFFSREGPAEAQLIAEPFGCGNSLLRVAALPSPTPFSTARNEIGGEDNLLFQTMKAAGARFVWSPDASVWEDPVPGRLTLAYALRRAFAYGQAPSRDAAAAARPAAIVRWMLRGLAQAALFGPLGLVLLLAGQESAAPLLDRAARGLGKTFWWGPFRQRLYGQAADLPPTVPARAVATPVESLS